MLQKSPPPGTWIGLLGILILYITFHQLCSKKDSLETNFNTNSNPRTNHKTCHIWLGQNTSDRGSLRYATYDKKEARLPSAGDAGVLGDPNTCLKADSRFDAYRASSTDHDWDAVQWGHVQKRCAADNQHLYSHEINTNSTRNYEIWRQPPSPAQTDIQPQNRGRTAVVLRTWNNFEYTENRRAWLRALIAETALHSAGHYEVFLLVNVKNNTINLEEDPLAYEQALQSSVPKEFRDMAILWNKRTLEKWYPKVKEHGVQDQMYQALQVFSHQFNFEHYWQLEMDVRLTSHVYDTLETAVEFAKVQRRRNLWERNGRYFMPQLYNGSFKAFAEVVDAEVGDYGVWGPVPTTEFQPKGPKPPPRSDTNWGEGEDADLISLSPMIDPIGSDWIYERIIDGFKDGLSTPRRAAFVSMTRSSRRLLQLVSEAQQERGQWLVSEAIMETFALLHGLKAVAIPHLVTFANDWSTQELVDNIQRGPPHNRAGGNSISSSFTTHGWVASPWWKSSYWCKQNDADNQWRAYLAGTCIPPMILHPIKDE